MAHDKTDQILDENLEKTDHDETVQCNNQEEFQKPQKKYSCKFCCKNFVKSQSLRNHFKTFHEGDKFECNSCEKSFVSAGNLKIHQKSMHDNIKFICESCHRSFATSQNLKAHKESIHENIKYNCNLCGKSMQYKSITRNQSINQ